VAYHFQRGSEVLKPLSWYKSLHDSIGRRESGAFLVEGVRAITQISCASPGAIKELLCAEDEIVPKVLDCPVRRLTRPQFKSVCLSRNPGGPLAVVAVPADAESASLPAAEHGDRILVCEDIQDPGNIGTLIRTAAALDFSGVLLSAKCADPFGPKAVQASAGTVLSLWLRRTKEFRRCIKGLVNAGFSCIAADVRGTETLLGLAPKRFALILGSEGGGLSGETLRLATHTVKIPINTKKAESLNVAASGAICMYLLTNNIYIMPPGAQAAAPAQG
jgi:TrmH family RNA methyltransferase